LSKDVPARDSLVALMATVPSLLNSGFWLLRLPRFRQCIVAYLIHPVGNWTSFAVSRLLIYFYVLHSLSAVALCGGGYIMHSGLKNPVNPVNPVKNWFIMTLCEPCLPLNLALPCETL